LERFIAVLPEIIRFVENNIITFLSSLLNNLGSSNIMVKKYTENILSKIKESVDKQILLQPLVNIIQFSSNSRQKPLLIDYLNGKLTIMEIKPIIDLIVDLQS
jgi:hypothetical protein